MPSVALLCVLRVKSEKRNTQPQAKMYAPCNHFNARNIGASPPNLPVSQHETPQSKLNKANFAAIQWNFDIESTPKPLRKPPGPEDERLAAKINSKSERLHLA